MSEVIINYWAVLVCAVVTMIIGSLWYGPLFGKMWMKLADIKMEGKKPNMTKLMVIAFIGSWLTAYVLAHAIIFASDYVGVYGVHAGLMGGFFNWLGFIVPVLLGAVLWEGKPWKLWMLNAAYYLVSLCVSGVILAVW